MLHEVTLRPAAVWKTSAMASPTGKRPRKQSVTSFVIDAINCWTSRHKFSSSLIILITEPTNSEKFQRSQRWSAALWQSCSFLSLVKSHCHSKKQLICGRCSTPPQRQTHSEPTAFSYRHPAYFKGSSWSLSMLSASLSGSPLHVWSSRRGPGSSSSLKLSSSPPHKHQP